MQDFAKSRKRGVCQKKMTDTNKKKDFKAATEAKKVPKAAVDASAE